MIQPTIVSVTPNYGVNYGPGYIGFSYRDQSIVSCGIAWFTRWDRGANPDVPDVPVSHAFVVKNETTIIEATNPYCREWPLATYFLDEHRHTFFRKPAGWTPAMGELIVAEAARHLGEDYGYMLVLGHALSDTLLGRGLNWITRGWTSKQMQRFVDRRNQEICSEMASQCLNSVPELKGKGILARRACEITPQALFQDAVIFEPWRSSR